MARKQFVEFINRILKNETACHVKLADLCDNTNLARIKNPTEEDVARVKKYREAADRILDASPVQDDIKDERVIKIDGCVSIQPFMSHDDFLDRFIGFVEEHGWYFGGGAEDVTDKGEE